VSKHFLRELEGLQRQILLMAGYVEEAISKAIAALQQRDRTLAQAVTAADDEVDDLDNEVTEGCLKLLALHQPVARDLRQITAVFMITTELERMGDLAADIAQQAVSLTSPTAVALTSPAQAATPNKLQRMADLTRAMVHQSLDAFVNLNGKEARAVIRMDDEVDRLNAEIIEELITRMKSSPDSVEPNLSLFSAVRHLERIADHATNIAEDALYLLDGEIVRHRPEAVAED
jgi:phosphate transport system protein